MRASSAENLTSFRYGMKCFFEEGRALAKINHPNVVRVLNFFRANETVYMVMRYERGRTLQQQIQMRQDQMSERLRAARVHAAAERPARSAHAQAAAPRHQAGQHLPAHRRHARCCSTSAPRARRSRPSGPSSRRCTRRASRRRSSTASPTGSGPWTDVYGVGASMFACLAAFAPQAADARAAGGPPRLGEEDLGGPVFGQRARGDRLVPAARSARAPAERVRAAEGDPRHPAEEAQAHVPRQPEAKLFSEIGAMTRRLTPRSTSMRFTIFQEVRKGSRKVNQDRIAYTYSRDTLLLVVADGMGGHAGGEIAAQIAVRLFIERFQQEAKPMLKNPLKFLQETMLRAHAALGSYAEPVLDARDAAHDVRRLHRAGGPRVLGARRRLAPLPVPAGRADRRRPRTIRRCSTWSTRASSRRRGRDASRTATRSSAASAACVDPVIDLSQAHAAAQRRRHRAVHRRPVERRSAATRWRRWLTSTPILKTAPQMMREAEQRGGADGDNLSAIVVRWGRRRWPTSRRRRSPRRSASASSRRRSTARSRSTDRKGIAARPHRRRDRARDRRDPVDDPAVPR